MECRLILAYVFTLTAIISPLKGRALETVSSQHDLPFTSSADIQEYTKEVTRNLYQTVEAILRVPADQQTFENTLKPWNRLMGDLAISFNQLNVFLEGSFSVTASQAMQDLRLVLIEICQDAEFHEALTCCSLKVNYNPASTPFERYIANQLCSNQCNPFAYIRGLAQEKIANEAGVTLLSLKSTGLQRGRGLNLEKILAANADVVCIYDIFADTAHEAFYALQKEYAHFLYVDVCGGVINFSELREGGLLIASKYNIEKPQFNRIIVGSTDIDEGFFDFIIKNNEESLGHIYLTCFKEDPYKTIQVNKFMNLIEKMQEDLSITEDYMPFFLCADFRALQSSEEGKVLMNTYFPSENNHTDAVYARLFQSMPAFRHDVLSPEYSISTTWIAMLDDCIGTLTLLRKEMPYSMNDILKNIYRNFWNKNYTFLCGGRADLSASKDSDGNASVEAKVSFSDKSDRGVEYSAGASVEVKRDSDGNVSTQAKANVGVDW